MSCLTPAELILFSLSSRGSANADHVRGCTSCDSRLAALRTRTDRAQTFAADHLDELALAELIDAGSDGAIDDIRLAHLAKCEQCQHELSELAALVRDPAVRAELDRPAWRTRDVRVIPFRRRSMRIAAGSLAAAAIVLLAVRETSTRASSSVVLSPYRHATIDVAAAPRLSAPLGNVSRADTLAWNPVPRADRYRVTVFDATGEIAWESEVADTLVAVPQAVSARWTGRLRWRVKARTSFDRWVDSDFGEFTVIGGAR